MATNIKPVEQMQDPRLALKPKAGATAGATALPTMPEPILLPSAPLSPVPAAPAPLPIGGGQEDDARVAAKRAAATTQGLAPAPIPAPISPDGGATLGGTILPLTAENVPGLPTQTATPSNIPPIVSTAENVPGLAPVPAPAPSPAPSPAGQRPDVTPQLTPTNPDNPLTGQTIAPPSALDRFRLAEQQFDTYVKGTDPAYQAALRDARRAGAAVGGLGSGDLRTTMGDLGARRANDFDTERRKLFEQALLGTVDDARFATGVAQQQQGFQSEQQQRAFMNELSRLGFDDALLNSAFGRALQTYMAGQAGGTGSTTALAGAASAGSQGRSALDALAELIRLSNAQRASGAANG